jgi:hypothetical protein
MQSPRSADLPWIRPQEETMNAMNGTATCAAGLGLALLLGACGSDGVVRPTPASPTPAPAVRTVLLTGSLALPSRTMDVEPFATPGAGTLDVTVDWTFPASPIGVYVVRGACDLDQFNARACNFLTRSETGQKPRTLTLPGVAAGDYFLLVANFSDEGESVALQIGHTTGGGAASAASDVAEGRAADPRFTRRLEALVGR